MAIKVLLLLVAISLSSSARVLTQSAISSVLQDILSPANTEKAMQLINIATSRSKMAMPVARVCNEPARFASDYYPDIPVRVIASDDYARALGAQSHQIRPVRDMKQIQPNLMDSLVIPKEIFQSFPVSPNIPSCQTPPQPNPYLPVASPVSAILPTNMPPPTQSRGQFLRKIPISPPTL